MLPSLASLLAFCLAYLFGSIPFGLITARMVGGIDIRQAGSGNIGATNVGRVLGARWGGFVLALDAAKGLLPTLLIPRLLAESGAMYLPVTCGIAAIIGHMFPIWLGFRGGKGVATALGIVVVLGPWATLAALLVFAASFGIWRIVSLSSILAAIAFGGCQLALIGSDGVAREEYGQVLFSLLVPALILVRHRANIGRLLRGEEARFRAGSRKPNADVAAENSGDATNKPT